jgi:chaperonin cofactor prefoldin
MSNKKSTLLKEHNKIYNKIKSLISKRLDLLEEHDNIGNQIEVLEDEYGELQTQFFEINEKIGRQVGPEIDDCFFEE